jgi:HprK-related kinase A
MSRPALDAGEWTARLQGTGIPLQVGPFTARLQTAIPGLGEEIRGLYGDNPISPDEDFADFHLSLLPRRSWRSLQSLVEVRVDAEVDFNPVPMDQALPSLEWILNWAIVIHANNYLIIHAATIAKDGFAAIMPGAPGAGKSTLTAALSHRGWRLLSDELALISPSDHSIIPIVRPISLKNNSIELIRRYLPEATLSRPATNTFKGTVALLKAPSASIAAMDEPARAAWVIFPKYTPGASASLKPVSKAASLLEIGNNAFNYSVYGAQGFEVLSAVMDGCACYSFTYSDLDEAVAAFGELRPSP